MIRVICFTILLLQTVVLIGQPVEICNNGIDDDGDGLSDCQDVRCFTLLDLTTGVEVGDLGFSHDIGIGDFDNDGDLDAFVVNLFSPDVVLFNNGLGGFVDSGQRLGSYASTCVAIGDLDLDGDLDAYVGGSNGSITSIWFNDGTGQFLEVAIRGAGLIRDVDLADVDNDGDLDAVESHSGSGDLVFINDGTGLFLTISSSFGSSNTRSIALGDLDSDGDVDALVANYAQPCEVWLNNGLGVFSNTGQDLGTSNSTDDCALSDLDGDGDLDVVLTGVDQAVWVNSGTGQFTPANQGVIYGDQIYIKDFDYNGTQDLLAVTTSAAPSTLYLGDSAGFFVQFAEIAAGFTTRSAAVFEEPQETGSNLFLINDAQSNVIVDLFLASDCNDNGIADGCDGDINADEIPDDCQDPLFRRGDPNGDGSMDIGDGVTVLGYLFGSTSIDCFDAGDSNDDGNLNIADAITILSALFTGGDSPPDPGPASCDLDPTPDSLGCESYGNCS